MPRIKGDNYICREEFIKLYKKAGYNQDSLSDALGISKRTIAGWTQSENQRPITISDAEKVANLFGVETADILAGKILPTLTRSQEGQALINHYWNGENKKVMFVREMLSDWDCELPFEDNEEYKELNDQYCSWLADGIIAEHQRVSRILGTFKNGSKREEILKLLFG